MRSTAPRIASPPASPLAQTDSTCASAPPRQDRSAVALISARGPPIRRLAPDEAGEAARRGAAVVGGGHVTRLPRLGINRGRLVAKLDTSIPEHQRGTDGLPGMVGERERSHAPLGSR